jgi:hypothetical protein
LLTSSLAERHVTKLFFRANFTQMSENETTSAEAEVEEEEVDEEEVEVEEEEEVEGAEDLVKLLPSLPPPLDMDATPEQVDQHLECVRVCKAALHKVTRRLRRLRDREADEDVEPMGVHYAVERARDYSQQMLALKLRAVVVKASQSGGGDELELGEESDAYFRRRDREEDNAGGGAASPTELLRKIPASLKEEQLTRLLQHSNALLDDTIYPKRTVALQLKLHPTGSAFQSAITATGLRKANLTGVLVRTVLIPNLAARELKWNDTK